MSNFDEERIEKYRGLFNFHDLFDVVLLAGYRGKYGATKAHHDFYGSIGKAIDSLGKTTFLPHRHLIGKSDDDSMGILTQIVMPKADIILEYDGVDDPIYFAARNAYLMNAFRPNTEGKKIINIYEKYGPLYKDHGQRAEEWNTVSLASPEESIERVLRIVRDFYSKR